MKAEAEAYLAFKAKHSFDMCEGATPYWRMNLGIIEKNLLDENENIFTVRKVMHAIYLQASYKAAELEYLGLSGEGLSQSRIHHLTHLKLFKEKTGIDPIGLDCVVEIGGGYG